MSYIAFHFLKNDFFNPANLLERREEIEGYFYWNRNGRNFYEYNEYAAKGCRQMMYRFMTAYAGELLDSPLFLGRFFGSGNELLWSIHRKEGPCSFLAQIARRLYFTPVGTEAVGPVVRYCKRANLHHYSDCVSKEEEKENGITAIAGIRRSMACSILYFMKCVPYYKNFKAKMPDQEK